MAAKFFTGMPLDGPDPECVHGHGEVLLAAVPSGSAPRIENSHARRDPAAQKLVEKVDVDGPELVL